MLRAIAILLLATSPAVADRCDAAKLEAEGNDQFSMGNTAPASPGGPGDPKAAH
jgi:hypothetical protein